MVSYDGQAVSSIISTKNTTYCKTSKKILYSEGARTEDIMMTIITFKLMLLLLLGQNESRRKTIIINAYIRSCCHAVRNDDLHELISIQFSIRYIYRRTMRWIYIWRMRRLVAWWNRLETRRQTEKRRSCLVLGIPPYVLPKEIEEGVMGKDLSRHLKQKFACHNQ